MNYVKIITIFSRMMIKKVFTGSLLSLLTLSGVVSAHAVKGPGLPYATITTATDQTAFSADAIRRMMTKVGSWEWKHIERKGWTYAQTDWTNGAMYAGMVALNQVADTDEYMQHLLRVGADNAWNTGPDRFFADDYCIGQMYAQLYSLYRDPIMIEKFRILADSIVAQPHDEPLEWVNNIHRREWAWCDALFMGPPALAYLTTATGDSKYLQTASRLWWKTSDFLFDKSEDLFFRDGRYIPQREKNGQKVFWSRGNGWVMGGLVRMMDNMPADFPERSRFEEQFKKMAYRVAKLQTADGTWHASLLDPDNYPAKETSGTGFYVYALTWGINNGLLPEKDFMPVIQKGWQALIDCVQEDGKLGFVQIPAAAPGQATANDTEVYGIGAFLLAGAELIKYDLNKHAERKIVITNPAGVNRQETLVELPYADFAKKLDKTTRKAFKIVNLLNSAELTYQLIYEGGKEVKKIVLQVSVVPGGKVTAAVIAGTPAKVPAKAYGRYVPERKDDYAWENDRIAFRMYGPALDKFPNENAHGIDVWAKRTTDMVIDQWYKMDNYHHDNGQGLDFYSVGLTLGAGDIAPRIRDSIYYPAKYKTYKVLDNGPLRTTFQLSYDTWNVDHMPVSVIKTISLDAGSQLNKMSVQYSFKGKALPVAVGIVRRTTAGTLLLDEKQGIMGYWEPAHEQDGTIGTGCVFTTAMPQLLLDRVHLLAPGIADSQQPFVYYTGASWSKGGRIANAQQWFEYLENFATGLKTPLQVTIR
jgi:unsaturated rhamnogalacturonyl hydrolase